MTRTTPARRGVAASERRRLVAACMLGSYDGTDVPDWLLDRIRDGLGGVLLFAQNVVDDAQVAATCARLRSARADVLIAIDEEGGDVTRLDAERGSAMPTPSAFGVVDDVQLTMSAYAALGDRVRSLGIDLTLAPCADINSNPLNPIIGLRSFGTTAERVSRHVVAAVDGLRAGGVSVCLKHFPGHGDTSTDSHVGAARIARSMTEISSRELVPFGAGVAAGADAVLTAHLVADALDDGPVSLSARWTDHLRHAIGFGGSIITDALDMDAVAMHRGIDGIVDAAVGALGAGADLLCLGSNFDAAMTDAVVDAASDAWDRGLLERVRLERSALRNAALRRPRRAEGADGRDVDGSGGEGSAAFVAAHAIRVDGALPSGPYAILECRPRLSMACFNVRWGVAADLAGRGWLTRTIASSDPLDPTCDAFVASARGWPVAVIVRDLDVQPWQRRVVERIVADRPDAVVVEMGWPSAAPAAGGVHVVTHGAAGSSAAALIELLSGAPSRTGGAS